MQDFNLIGIDDFIPDKNSYDINMEDFKDMMNLWKQALLCCHPKEEEEILDKIKNCIRNETKLEDSIDSETLDRIEENIKYRLGNGIKINNMKEAIEELFTRDYLDKNQIFVPEYFLSETPYDWGAFCEMLETRANNENLSVEEMEHLESKMQQIRQEAVERNAYETLKDFFKNHREQEVTVLHGYELMDLTDGAT